MFFLMVLMFAFASLINGQEDCPYLKACLEETNGQVTRDDVNQILSIRSEQELDQIPTAVLCVLKCALEKREILVGEAIDPQKMAAFEELMSKIRDRNSFIACVEMIQFRSCDDMREYLKCTMRNYKH